MASGHRLAVQAIGTFQIGPGENLLTQEPDTKRPDDTDDDWDLENAVRHPGGRGRSSVVVSVRLARADFDKLARQAEADEMPVSTFMRVAALERIDGKPSASIVSWGGSGGGTANFHTNAIFGGVTSADLEVRSEDWMQHRTAAPE